MQAGLQDDVQDREVAGRADRGSGRQMEDSGLAQKVTLELGIKG